MAKRDDERFKRFLMRSAQLNTAHRYEVERPSGTPADPVFIAVIVACCAVLLALVLAA